MSKTVLMFPGQASQYVGMAQDLHNNFEEVRNLYKLASDELAEDIAKLSFEGPADKLKQTRFTQPAILLHSLAVLTALKESLPQFDYACGHSLGEYSALAATGAMSFELAIKAVVKRASLMEQACLESPGSMAAIIGLTEEKVLEICRKASKSGVVVPANFNSKSQIVISGSVEAVKVATEIAKSEGARRAMILEVGGAFHSPLMEPAKSGMQQFLKDADIKSSAVPVIANVTAKPAESSAEIKQLLVAQITSPVKWSQTMSYLVSNDCTNVIEIGPGKVLAGMAKRDMSAEKITNLDTIKDIESLAAVSV
ncbi:MAG: ACP S-malonyltransferase [candidate division Zixibacteria bacterium]|nr:ACP S-malonyltransferase [candidate division Zixibacteria bacterium]